MKWHTSKEYLCVRLGGQSYLLPCGQKIVDFYSGFRINEIGVSLWQAMEGGAGEEELLGLLCRRYQAGEEDIPLLRRDLAGFLKQLEKRGALRAERPFDASGDGGQRLFFHAGALKISYEGPEAVYESYLRDFACEAGAADQRVEVLTGRPSETLNGTVLVRNGELILMEGEERYILLFPGFQDIYELHVTKDGSRCRIYCSPKLSEEEQENIFHAMRFAFLILAQRKNLCVVHSASLLYRGRAWLFSGKSGTGKSTHTNLWKDLYGVPLLNGDLNCLGIRDGQARVYGLPWCGTSGIAEPGEYPLGGVLFLKQCGENQVQELTEADRQCSLAMRMITPTWTPEQLGRNLELAGKISEGCVMARLCCTKEPEAAEVMRQYIDSCLDRA